MSNSQVVTFGCRLNIFESEVIKNKLKEAGLDNTIIFNSCSVTSEAERQLRQSIRKHKRAYPEQQIIVTGCAAQIDPQKYAQMPEVDQVIGNSEKLELSSYSSSNVDKVRVKDIMSLTEAASHMVSSFSGKARAYLEIQNGCNHRCTFCIIPYGRGNNRSVPIEQILVHCQKIIAEGYNEIVLTGVDITDYGFNLANKPTLGFLVKNILALNNELRVRLSSLDVAEIDDDLKELIVTEKRLMPHFHLSLQSGDDLILKRMKRRHSQKEIIDFCNFVRLHRPDASIGADIIAGFPTETEAMFNNSLNLIKHLEIALLHVFPYSEREGTAAARIPSERQVPINIRKKRAKILIEQGKENLANFAAKFIGHNVSALVESEHILKTDQFIKIKAKNHGFPLGSRVVVKVTKFQQDYLCIN